MDLTICMDISPNPGPNINSSDATNSSGSHSIKSPSSSSCMGAPECRVNYPTYTSSFLRRLRFTSGSNYIKHNIYGALICFNTGKHLRLCCLNARSIKNKSADFVCDGPSTGADIFAITETWLTERDMAHKAEIILPGFKLLDYPRVGRMGGGTALLFRENIEVKRNDGGERKSFEFSEWIIQYYSTKLRIIIVYRIPYSTAHPICASVFFDEFSSYLESVIMSYGKPPRFS